MKKFLLTTAIIGASSALPAAAATITDWDKTNVKVGTAVTGTDTGASIVYQDTAKTITNSKIVYAAPEANTPGIEVLDEVYIGTKGQDFSGCLKTSSTAVCNDEFQSGKRIKQQITSVGPTDLVFGVEVSDDDTTTPNTAVYQVFHRLINVTGGDLSGFTIELGTGVGDTGDGKFEASGDSDGLRFATTDLNLNPDSPLRLGPDDATSFSQFPYGLFGGEPLNPNPLELKGFFDIGDNDDPDNNGRAGFEVTQTEDMITSGDFYGTYDDRFGEWLTQGEVPAGLFWDYETGVDPLLMAALTENGQWEVRRDILDGVIDPITGMWGTLDAGDVLSLADAEFFNDIAGVEGFLGLLSGTLLDGPIEDLANLNLSFGIEVNDFFAANNSSFTLRVTPTASGVSAVPLPAGLPLLLAGVGMFGFLRSRRSS